MLKKGLVTLLEYKFLELTNIRTKIHLLTYIQTFISYLETVLSPNRGESLEFSYER